MTRATCMTPAWVHMEDQFSPGLLLVDMRVSLTEINIKYNRAKTSCDLIMVAHIMLTYLLKIWGQFKI